MRALLTLITGFLMLCYAASALAGSAFETPSCDEATTSDNRAFDPFLFSVLGNCDQRGDGTTFFRTTTTLTYPVLGKDEAHHDIVIYVRLNLLGDQTYWGEYSEDLVISKSNGVTELQSRFLKTITGGWHIYADRLIIDHLGEATITSRDRDYPKAELLFTNVFRDSRLLGHKITIGPATTDIGPHGESVARYCRTLL